MRLLRGDGTEVSEEVQRYASGVARLPIVLDHAEQLEDAGMFDTLLAVGLEPKTEDGSDLEFWSLSITAHDQRSWATFYEGVGFIYVLSPGDPEEEMKILVCPVPGPGDDARRVVLTSGVTEYLDRIGVADRRIVSAGAKGQA